jgi:hypothetical protein
MHGFHLNYAPSHAAGKRDHVVGVDSTDAPFITDDIQAMTSWGGSTKPSGRALGADPPRTEHVATTRVHAVRGPKTTRSNQSVARPFHAVIF